MLLAGVVLFLVTSTLCSGLLPDDREVPVVTRGLFGIIRSVGFGLGGFLCIWGALKLETKLMLAGASPKKNRFFALVVLVGDASFVLYLIHNIAYEVVAALTKGVAPKSMLFARRGPSGCGCTRGRHSVASLDREAFRALGRGSCREVVCRAADARSRRESLIHGLRRQHSSQFPEAA